MKISVLMDALKKLKDLLEQFQITYEIVSYPDSVRAEEAVEFLKDRVGIEVVDTEDGWIVLVVSGQGKGLDFEELREQLGYERFELADAEEVFLKTGFFVGNFPLTGHDLPCILQNCLLQKEFIYGSTGETGYFLKIAPADISQLNHIIALF